MGILPFRRSKPEDNSQLYSLLTLAQSGNEGARNELIAAYTPFILRIASQAAHRFIERGRDDEFSVALIAFNEAIDRYDDSRKSNFLGFAETIIRRRLIDYFRAQRSHRRFVPWTTFDMADDEDNVVNHVEVQASIAVHEQATVDEDRKLEIEMFASALHDYGLTFGELVELSPKHSDARANAAEVARVVASDDELRSYVRDRKALPLKLLEQRVGVSRKTMERQRKYILAMVVLLCGDYPHLQGYLVAPADRG